MNCTSAEGASMAQSHKAPPSSGSANTSSSCGYQSHLPSAGVSPGSEWDGGALDQAKSTPPQHKHLVLHQFESVSEAVVKAPPGAEHSQEARGKNPTQP